MYTIVYPSFLDFLLCQGILFNEQRGGNHMLFKLALRLQILTACVQPGGWIHMVKDGQHLESLDGFIEMAFF